MITKTISPNGTIRYRNEQGKLHNEGDEPAVIWRSGEFWYYKNGQSHRDGDLPAVIFKNGTVYYSKNDQWHRLAGPARIYSDGSVEYWIHGKKYTKEGFNNHPLVKEYRLKKVVEDLLSD